MPKPKYTASEIRKLKSLAKQYLDILWGRGEHNAMTVGFGCPLLAANLMRVYETKNLKAIDRWSRM